LMQPYQLPHRGFHQLAKAVFGGDGCTVITVEGCL
jgi:hypothetical protein